MGIYFNPQDGVKVGRPLNGRAYVELRTELKEGEYLFGLYDRYMFKNAPWLFDQQEFDEFDRQVRQGTIKFEGFFAIPESELKNGVTDSDIKFMKERGQQ